jgi:endonuclease III
MLKKWRALLRKLAGDQPAPSHSAEQPPAPLTVISAAIHGTLLWEASVGQARLAYQHLTQQFADYNDMRVALPSQLIMAIGERYPLAAERCVRLKSWLSDLYRRSNALDLEHLRDVARPEARERLRSLQGLPEFAAAFAAMTSLGDHAIPVDDRLLQLLVNEKVVDSQTTPAQAMARLETMVGPDELPSVYALMRSWSDHDGTPPRRDGSSDAFRPVDIALPPPPRRAESSPVMGKAKAGSKTTQKTPKPRPRTK